MRANRERSRLYSQLLNSFLSTSLQRISIFFFPIILFFGSSPAHAWRLYSGWDAGVTALMLKSKSYFGGDTADTLSYSGAGAFTFAWDPSKVGSPGHYNLGIQLRANMAKSSSASYVIYAPYLIGRVVVKKIYITLGVSPYPIRAGGVMTEHVSGKMLILGEFGYEYPITPEVSFEFLSGAQFGAGSGGMSPMPVIDAMIGLRFYMLGPSRFIDGRKGYGNGGPGEYEGYRYPFGYPKN